MGYAKRWQKALYELCENKSDNAHDDLEEIDRLREFEDIIDDLARGHYESAVADIESRPWLQEWLDKYNLKEEYELYSGYQGSLSDPNIPVINSVVNRDDLQEDEGFEGGREATIWTVSKEEAKEHANYDQKEEWEDSYGALIKTVAKKDQMYVDVKNLVKVMTPWYERNEDIKERWNNRFGEEVITEFFGRFKKKKDEPVSVQNVDLLKGVGLSKSDIIKPLQQAIDFVITKDEVNRGKVVALWYNIHDEVKDESIIETRGDW